MSLFDGLISVKGITFLMFSVFAVIFFGYVLGRISIKGVSLGTAGVFIVALLYGALFFNGSLAPELKIGDVGYASNALKVIENLGLVFFVTAVGFIAGPNFFKDLRKNYKSYVFLGIVIILVGGLTCVGCLFLGKGLEASSNPDGAWTFPAMLVGILSGALTSTPAFSAAKETVETVVNNALQAGSITAEQATEYSQELETAVTVGHGIAYLFGVIGVVLFVQLIPKILKANMEEERAKIVIPDTGIKREYKGRLFVMDGFGLCAMGLAVVIGIFIGNIKIPLDFIGLNGTFSLTTTGGALMTALVLGHFGRIGFISLRVEKRTLEVFRELGLMLFLIGAGIPGGAKFIELFDVMYFVYGVAMTIIPMIIGFIIAKFVLKFPLLNNLGSITGGMTSTPALGTLIGVSKSDNVASSYAATYPIALVAVVLVSQVILLVWQKLPIA